MSLSFMARYARLGSIPTTSGSVGGSGEIPRAYPAQPAMAVPTAIDSN